MMKWPKEVKAHMNMTEKAKADDELVEVIYACMDGYVYFLDLRTGEKTRDPLYLGYTFKGAGALDPRGYPIMYVGAGYNSNEGTAKVFVVNLLDCSVMYTFGDNDEFSLRGSLSFFDGSALVDAETDTLIYPGENGILYLIRLNTKYDLNSGTLSIDPGRTVKWRYYGTRSSTESFWLGMEDSAAIYKGYIFMTDNGGNLMCLDLNTLQLASDVFYRQPSDEKPTYWEKLRDEKGCLAVEMESFALFHNARVLGKRAACLLTISDSFVSPEITTAEQRQTSFTAMMKVALGVDAFLEK